MHPPYRYVSVSLAALRWNSYASAFERAAQLRGPIESITEHLIERWNNENSASKRRRRAGVQAEKKSPPRYVSEGGLSEYDWHVINNYIEILAPLKEATKLLEARGSSGKHGAIWEVLPTFEWLLNLFEELKERVRHTTTETYPDQEPLEDHFETNINAGWQKLVKYYEKLDDTPVYYASVVLHPQHKDLLKKAWREKPEWLRKNDAAFKKLWSEYRDRSITSTTSNSMPPPPRRVHARSGRDDFLATFAGDEEESDGDEYTQWSNKFKALPKEHPLAQDPIKYWWQERATRPKLAQMALDVLSVPATSCDCERAFSELGDLLEPRRSKLKPEMIAALQCCKSYRKMGFKKASQGKQHFSTLTRS